MKYIALTLIASLSLLNASSLSETPSSNSLIVYNSNMGLVHEERDLSLKRSDKEIVYKGVASTIDTNSINVELPKGVMLYSQQYRYDKLTQQKLLETHIGKVVEVEGSKVTLLAYSGSECLVKTVKNKIRTVASKDILFSKIPNSLLTKPSLVWNIQTNKNVDATMKLDYVINNISWKSNYILNLHEDSADLSGWISINNNAGKAFKDTTLYVLAGDVNRVKDKHNRPRMMYMKSAMADVPKVREQAHEGYHFYTIPFQVNLKNHEKTEIKFVQKNGLDIRREYSAMLSNPLYLKGERKSDVLQYVHLSGLDVSLPKGVVRTYAKLNKTSILLGESSVRHTPKNTPLNLKLGKNFDLKVTQTVTAREDYKKSFHSNVRYMIRNASDEERSVKLFVPFNARESSVVETKQKYKFTKGNLLTFSVKVKANARTTFDVYYESKK